MNPLERFAWNVRGNAARWVVEDYDDPVDAMMLPVVFWGIASVVGYVAFHTAELTAGGIAVTGILLMVSLIAALAALESTIGAKYYFTEWAADVRPPEGVR